MNIAIFWFVISDAIYWFWATCYTIGIFPLFSNAAKLFALVKLSCNSSVVDFAELDPTDSCNNPSVTSSAKYVVSNLESSTFISICFLVVVSSPVSLFVVFTSC